MRRPVECFFRWFQQNRARRRAFAAAGLGGILVACLAMVNAFEARSQKGAIGKRHAHRSTHPLLTGSDGSETGIADFLGNFTAITSASQSTFLLQRQPDCSLTLYSGVASSTNEPDVTATIPHYERMLHQLASLKTTDDVFAKGCTEPSTGISSRPVLSLGYLSTGQGHFAAARGMGTGTVAADLSTFTYTPHHSVQFVDSIATGDLNGDGNADLVAVNGAYGATSSYISVLLGNADGTFLDAVTYPAGGTTAATAVVDDLNGDGKLDVVVVSADQQFSVLLGNGDGTLQAAQSFAAPAPPGSSSAASAPIVNLITADLRGTGKKDIIASNGLVLMGNGDGTFTAAAAAAFPYMLDNLSAAGPNLASGDLNNDGKPDLVVNTGGEVFTWIGKGDGTFTAGVSYDTVSDSGYVTVSDLDGDGNADIYAGLANGGSYSADFDNPSQSYVLMGHGDGTFSGAPTSLGMYNGANLVDVNGDGLPDLITNTAGPTNTAGSSFIVQLGTTAGAFNPVSTITAPASFTLNGTTITGANTTSVSAYAAGDINGDGKADLAFADNGLNTTPGNQTPLPVYFTSFSKGDGTFATPSAFAFPQVAPAGDFDNGLMVSGMQIAAFTASKHNDLIFTFSDQIGGTAVANPYVAGFALLPGNGDGTFKAPVITTTFSSATANATTLPPQIVNAADFNGDGEADLLVAVPNFTIATGAGSALELFLSKGDGTFKAPVTITNAPNPDVNGSEPVPCTVADFNKDGKLDVACLGETSASQAQLGISLGNGDGTFAAPVILNAGGGDAIRSSGIGAADFNGDGNVDLALLDGEDFSGIFYGNGNGTFTSVPSNGNFYPKDLINLAASGATIATDLNGDGKPDVLARNVVLINSYGTGAVTPPATATTTALTASAATINAGASVTFTATVTGTAGTPTGTVTFLDNTTTLGTGTLNASGVATYSSSALTTGAHSITAQYGGDSNFAASTSKAVTVTVQAAVPPSFKLGASPASLTIAAGQKGTATVTVTPSGGFTQPVTFACSGLPSEATCTFAPATVTPGASAVTTTLTVSTTAAQASVLRSGMAGLLALGSVLLLVMPGSRRVVRWSRLFGLAVALSLSGAFIGCGGGNGGSGSSGSSGSGGNTTSNPGTPSGTSTVTITATSGSISQTASLQVTVQ
jgi:Bacterial Ig-like domain (group 3)/FG-GAP-like repeat/FG-GAP repeat